MNDAMRRLEGLIGEWDVTMTHAWFLDSLDTEIKARRQRIVMGVIPGRIDMRADASDDAGQTWRKDLDYIFQPRSA